MAKDYPQAVKSLDGMGRDVTTWESEFLETCVSMLAGGKVLSKKQEGVLDGMWAKYFPDDDFPEETPDTVADEMEDEDDFGE